MHAVPKKFQFLFPSSQVEDLRTDQDSVYIIENLLRNATLEAWQWMFQTYKDAEIKHVVKTSSNLRLKDVMLWSSYFKVPLQEIACTQTKSPSGLKSSWAY